MFILKIMAKLLFITGSILFALVISVNISFFVARIEGYIETIKWGQCLDIYYGCFRGLISFAITMIVLTPVFTYLFYKLLKIIYNYEKKSLKLTKNKRLLLFTLGIIIAILILSYLAYQIMLIYNGHS